MNNLLTIVAKYNDCENVYVKQFLVSGSLHFAITERELLL